MENMAATMMQIAVFEMVCSAVFEFRATEKKNVKVSNENLL